MVRIGAHFHVDHPLDEAIARGADAAQFFLGDPQGWKGPVIPGGDPAAVRDASIVYFPDEGWLDPVTYAHAMLEAAQRAGFDQILTRSAFTRLLPQILSRAVMTGDRSGNV